MTRKEWVREMVRFYRAILTDEYRHTFERWVKEQEWAAAFWKEANRKQKAVGD